MAKSNEKVVVRFSNATTLRALGNLFQSCRERKIPHREDFCKKFSLPLGNVAYIETGRFLKIDVSHLNIYLAAVFSKNDRAFKDRTKNLYNGLKAVEEFVKKI